MQKALSRPTFFYGWVIVAVAFLMAFLMAGAGSGFGVFVIPMSNDFGWSRATISVAFFISTIVSGLSQPFLGRLYDVLGGRKVILVSMVVMGLCTVLLSLTFHILFFILIFGIVMSIARSGGSLAATSWILTRWFRKKRATVLALAMAGSSAGALILVPFAAYFLGLTGWRTTWVFLGGMILVLAVPLAFFFLRDDPKDLGLLPDGDPEPSDAPGVHLAQSVRGPLEVDRWRDSLRSLPIWQFSGAYWGCGFITSMMFVHFIPFAEGKGLSSSTAATAFGLMSGLNVVGLIATSFLSDRFVRKNVLASVYAMRVFAFALLLLAPGAWGIWGFALIMGLSWYSSAPLTTSLTADIYGLKTLGTLNGISFLAHQIGGSFGVLLAGFLYDATGSYLIPFALAGLLMIWASLAAFSIREKRYSIKYQPPPASAGTSGSSTAQP